MGDGGSLDSEDGAACWKDRHDGKNVGGGFEVLRSNLVALKCDRYSYDMCTLTPLKLSLRSVEFARRESLR